MGFDGPPALASAARALIGTAPAAPDDPDLVVLLSEGPLDRERADELVREGRAHLTVESGHGQGSTFTVTLPAEVPAPADR